MRKSIRRFAAFSLLTPLTASAASIGIDFVSANGSNSVSFWSLGYRFTARRRDRDGARRL
jgi:hypothetical protein